MRLINRFKTREIIGILLLGILLSCCMKTIVNSVSDFFIQQTMLTIRIPEEMQGGNHSVMIIYDGEYSDIFPELKEACHNSGNEWVYFEGVPGESWTSISSDKAGAQISFWARPRPDFYITFLANKNLGGVIIETKKGEYRLNCYIDQDASEIIRYYPFKDFKYVLIVKFLLYVILCVFFVSLLGFLINCIKTTQIYIPKILKHKPTALDFLALWLLLFLVAVFIYKVIGIPNYLQIGDESGYWKTLLLVDGKWDTKYLASQYTFRGYWCYVLQTVARYAGDWLEIDASIVWMLFPSAAISWLATVIMPTLYRCLTDAYAKRIHIIPIVLPFVTTWKGLLTSVLMDLFGVVTLYACITYILVYFKEGKYRDAVLAGIAGGVSCSFRTSNLWGIVVVTICGFILFKARECVRAVRKLYGLGLAILIFLIISVPQFIINDQRGHFGFLPYDYNGAYAGRSLTIWSSEVAMTHGNISHPVLATDDQILTMKNQHYHNSTALNMNQLLDVYIYSPLESIMLIVKKLIIGFDIKTNLSYPENPVPWRETSGMLFSLWNYFVLYGALFVLFRSKKININERILSILIFTTLVLPQTFMKIEWRYIIAGYVYLCYHFSYHFCDTLIVEQTDRKKEILENTYFLIGLAVFMFIYLTCSFTFLA